ncbi:GerAB/ArcD/ProY family transporter [Bacillus sp. DJP31]|uniref:GerAB/ArcD/ProY family transporter n=1 Tax=Bacillus sp. DJP31 TaxID=3409789 RepID=UPI003BB69C4F
MIKQSDGKIGTREFLGMIILTIGLKMSDITPATLFPFGKTATWMLPIISMFIVIVPYFLLLKVLGRYEGKGLIDIVFILTGRYIGFGIGFLLFVFMLTNTVLYTRSYSDIMGSMYFTKTPPIIIIFLFMFTAYFIANRGLEGLGRTSWLTVPYFIISLVVLVALIWTDLKWSHLTPILGSGPLELIVEGTKHSFILGEILLFAVLYPFVRTHKNFRTASLIGVGASAMLLVVFYAIFIMIYDYPPIESMTLPYQQLTRIVELGPVFGNSEVFFLGFWAIASITRLAIYLYVTVALFGSTLRIHEFEPLLLPFAAVIFFFCQIPESNIVSILLLRDNRLLQWSWFMIIGLPFLLFVISEFKKEGRKREKI